MPIYISAQYSVWCDLCESLEDYQEFRNQKMAEREWKKLGWKKVDGIWVCPKCVNAQQSFAPDSSKAAVLSLPESVKSEMSCLHRAGKNSRSAASQRKKVLC